MQSRPKRTGFPPIFSMSFLPLRLLNTKRLKFIAIALFSIATGILFSQTIGLGHIVQQPTSPNSGGDLTVLNRSSRAFSQTPSNLTAADIERHGDGDAAFEAVFVTPPAVVNAGLGPVFNNPSCTGCHIKDGRGMPHMGQSLVRVSLPQGKTAIPGDAVPVPGIGTQIRDRAVYGHQPDARVEIEWQEQAGQYADGTGYTLRSPHLDITRPDGQPLPPETLTSLRVPPPVFGTGLLNAIPASEILALADADDTNHDGISGHPNFVWDEETKQKELGRFGLKANTPNLLQQTAAAYVNDMGVTNPLFPEPDGTHEIDRKTLEDNTFYMETLGVPARTLVDDPTVRKGEKLFAQANCAVCHINTLKTGDSPIAAIAHQTIHPYTDLLVHDMGQGLADNRPDFDASGSEWRTAPLWGVGLTQTVLPYSGFLHDGRARTLAEAILWHGGEAEASKEQFRTMAKGDREALLKFLTTL
jgi:CxxC motif-containing protein (DUF1111 family)